MHPVPATQNRAMEPSEAHTDAFYGAAARRFGPAADASWPGTPADLTELDRLELLLRDAASVYPDAFSARRVRAAGTHRG